MVDNIDRMEKTGLRIELRGILIFKGWVGKRIFEENYKVLENRNIREVWYYRVRNRDYFKN